MEHSAVWIRSQPHKLFQDDQKIDMVTATDALPPTAPLEAKKIRYVYLCSAPHSGSTLIACLLGAHSAVSTVGELGSVCSRQMPCSCGETLEHCEFWNGWEDRAAAAGIDFHVGQPGIDLKPVSSGNMLEDLFYYQFRWRWLDRLRDILFRPTSSLQRQAEQAVTKSLWLVRDLCTREHSQVFVDTTKNPYQIQFLVRRPDIDLKVIALVRDGRGVMNSMIHKEGCSPQQSIDGWLWSNRHLERAVRNLPTDKVLRLRLEDLCSQPEENLKRLLHFCGVDSEETLDASVLENRHIIGNAMRHRFTGEIRLDEKWRTTLSQRNQELFHKRAGQLNRKLGYE